MSNYYVNLTWYDFCGQLALDCDIDNDLALRFCRWLARQGYVGGSPQTGAYWSRLADTCELSLQELCHNFLASLPPASAVYWQAAGNNTTMRGARWATSMHQAVRQARAWLRAECQGVGTIYYAESQADLTDGSYVRRDQRDWYTNYRWAVDK